MLANNSEYIYQFSSERIANFQAEAYHDTQVRKAKDSVQSTQSANWTTRQRMGYTLMRWGYRLAKDNKTI